MNLCLKIIMTTAVFSVLLANFIHHPIPDDVHDRIISQFMNDLVHFVENLAELFELMGFSNRWWPYRFEISTSTFPDDMKGERVKLAGVDCDVITPKKTMFFSSLSPAIIFYHGGGFVTGSLNTYRAILSSIARNTGFVVVSPEYRLAPEYPFPIPYEDCLNSTIKFFEKAKEFGVDPKKIVIAGDSAGANLAVSVTLQLMKMNEFKNKPAMLVSICSVLQMVNYRLPSYQQNKGNIFKTTTSSKFWLSYIGLNHRLDLSEIVCVNGHIRKSAADKTKMINAEFIPDQYKQGYNSTRIPLTSQQTSLLDLDVIEHMEESAFDVRIAPLMAKDNELKQLPPTYIMVNEYDQLRDDGIIFHERLKNLNTEVTFHMVEKSLHVSFVIGMISPNTYYGEQNKIMFEKIKNHFQK